MCWHSDDSSATVLFFSDTVHWNSDFSTLTVLFFSDTVHLGWTRNSIHSCIPRLYGKATDTENVKIHHLQYFIDNVLIIYCDWHWVNTYLTHPENFQQLMFVNSLLLIMVMSDCWCFCKPVLSSKKSCFYHLSKKTVVLFLPPSQLIDSYQLCVAVFISVSDNPVFPSNSVASLKSDKSLVHLGM